LLHDVFVLFNFVLAALEVLHARSITAAGIHGIFQLSLLLLPPHRFCQLFDLTLKFCPRFLDYALASVVKFIGLLGAVSFVLILDHVQFLELADRIVV
jgi:hypothetical protein